jgi:deoxycytidylate deaminase
MIFQSGIKSVFYKEEYRDTAGIDFLEKGGINVNHYQKT